MKKIISLSQLEKKYKAIFCDAWGVIHNGMQLFPEVKNALGQYVANGGYVIIVTNAPRPNYIVKGQLGNFGLNQNHFHEVVTSGDVCHYLVKKYKGKKAFRIGPAKDDQIYEDLNIEFSSLDNSDFIICTGLLNDLEEEPDDYKDLFKQAIEKNLKMLCVNPDKVVIYGDRKIYCAGALAEKYEEMGGMVNYCGKPYIEIYDLCFEKVTSFKNIHKDEILCIGDNLHTDIYGAINAGYDILYIDSGVGGDVDGKQINYHMDFLR